MKIFSEVYKKKNSLGFTIWYKIYYFFEEDRHETIEELFFENKKNFSIAHRKLFFRDILYNYILY